MHRFRSTLEPRINDNAYTASFLAAFRFCLNYTSVVSSVQIRIRSNNNWSTKQESEGSYSEKSCFKGVTQCAMIKQRKREVERDILEKLAIAKFWHWSPVNSFGHLTKERKPERERNKIAWHPNRLKRGSFCCQIRSLSRFLLWCAWGWSLTCNPKP